LPKTHIRAPATLTVAVKEPEVEHTVLIRDFANWLASNGKSPAEQALKTDLRVLLNAGIDDKTGTTGSPEEYVWVYLCDLPAFHVIEYGQVMCPPGDP
jgi:hypothetical protein